MTIDNQLENSFNDLRKEMEVKVTAAIKILEEAAAIASKDGNGLPKYYDEWYDLRDIVGQFIDLDKNVGYDGDWECSFY